MTNIEILKLALSKEVAAMKGYEELIAKYPYEDLKRYTLLFTNPGAKT